MRRIEYSPKARNNLLEIGEKIAVEYGKDISNRIIKRIIKNIRNLAIFEMQGISVSGLFDIKCDFRYFYTEQNYVFYRVEKERIKVIAILNERQDFMQILFDIKTTSDDTEDYWYE